MTIQTQISDCIATGKEVAIDWATDFLSKSENGEDVQSLENKLILLTNWIDILEDYQVENFDEDGPIEPDTECLTLERVQALMSKVNSLAC